MTKTEANRIRRWFQKNVGLAGWEIVILPGLLTPDGPIAKDAMGQCDPDIPYHSTRIWINALAEGHIKGKGVYGDDRHTLFHELIHCFFAECGIINDGDPAEWGVNQLASNLLRLYLLETK